MLIVLHIMGGNIIIVFYSFFLNRLTFRYRNKQIFFLFWKEFFIRKLSSRHAADRRKKFQISHSRRRPSHWLTPLLVSRVLEEWKKIPSEERVLPVSISVSSNWIKKTRTQMCFLSNYSFFYYIKWRNTLHYSSETK